jgi:integrase
MGLSDAQRVDAVRATAILASHGVSLTTAAEAFHKRAALLSRTVPFSKLRDELVAAKRADRKSSRYLSDLKNRLAVAGRTFDGRPVAAIESRELDDWLRGLGLSPTSRVNFRKVLHTAFEFAVMRGYATENPVVKTAKVKADHPAPGILTPREIAAMLTEADPRIAAGIALSAFAGLRDAEIGRMTWDRVDLTGGHIKIDAGIAKTASRRLVPISDNLRAWLAPLARKNGEIRPSPRLSYPLYRTARKAASEKLIAAGEPAKNLEDWPINALRHSFASYRLALVANAAQVAEECGHSIQIMKQHYRELVTPAEARAWFAVMPPGTD